MSEEYTVNPVDRIAELLPADKRIAQGDSLNYSFANGYEKFDINYADGGGYHYAGAYHPEGICEGGGICIHCGRTLEVS